MALFDRVSDFLFGRPEETKRVSTLGAGQEPILANLLQALQGGGAGGAFGESADYYRDLLDPSGQAQEAFAAPALRQFQEELIPDLAERFAGMGSGALSSSGFRNAATREAGSLSERLASMRAGLQGQGAAGLSGLGTQGLGRFEEQLLSRGTKGFLPQLAEGFGPAIGTAVGAPAGKGISSLLGLGSRGI
jgi:hypothetical protein